MWVILPSSTWLQLAVGHGGATDVWSWNQVRTSGPSTKTCSTTMSVTISDMASRPSRHSLAPAAWPRGPSKVTSSASSAW